MGNVPVSCTLTFPIGEMKSLNRDTIAADMERDGFAIIEFPDPQIDYLAEDIWRSLQTFFNWDAWKQASRLVSACLMLYGEGKRCKIAPNPVILDLLSTAISTPATGLERHSVAIEPPQPHRKK